MNDRFNFRGQTENGKWIYGSLLWYAGDPQIWDKDGNNFIVKSETVGQCTGLRDKNGKLVYEKDILLSPDYDEPYMVIVEWDNEKGYIVKAWNGKEFEYALSDDTLESLKYFEIIGNEFTNPELLEKRHE